MTEPVLKLDPPTHRILPPTPRAGWARDDRERCICTCGVERRCMLREGHEGLHAWRSLGGLRVFEWG